jgi:hypothetical protein
VLFLVILLIVLSGALYVAVQTETFQTWAAHKATAYLSDELGTKVDVGRLKITFIKDVTLENVFVGDKHNDTLVCGESIRVTVNGFSYEKKKLRLEEAELKNIKVKLIKYKGEKEFNFQFLADYLDSGPDTPKDTTPSPWKITYGNLILKDVDFLYRLMRDTDKVVNNMNYNNIHVSNINGRFSDIDFKGDTIYAQIHDLNAVEQCGMTLNSLTTKVKLSPVQLRCDSITLRTPNSYVKGGFSFNYSQWEDYLDFINKVYIKGRLKDSTFVNMKDIAYFAEDINGFKETFFVKGNVRGYVNELNGNEMDVSYGSNTRFMGDISFTGLPDIDKSYIHFDAEQLSTSKQDLERFPIPPFDKPSYLALPSEMSKLGVMTYRGKFDGFINNFATYGTFKTGVGNIKTDLQLDNTKKVVQYSGSITSTNFNLSKLFPGIKQVGAVSLSAKVKGKGFNMQDLDTKFDGVIQSITVNQYKYDNVKIDGLIKNKIFEGNVVSKDTNANFDFNGTVNFTNRVPKMDFISTVNNFDLEKTHFSTSKLNGKVSSQIYINLNGDNIDNLSGQINFDNTIYKTAEKTYKLSTFNLELDQATSLKNIKLSSSIVNARMKGKYKLSTLPHAFEQYINSYFPTFVKNDHRYIYNDEAEIKIRIKDFTLIKELFIKDLMISPDTRIETSFDAAISYLNLKTNCDLIDYAGVKIKKNSLNINSLPHGISLDYAAGSINLTDSFAFKNPVIKLNANDRTTRFDIGWNNRVTPNNSGTIGGTAFFENSKVDIKLDKAKFIVVDSIWQVVKATPITIDTSFAVSINSLTFYNQNQLITFDGKLSDKREDKIDVFIQNFKLSQFNGFLSASKINVDGTVTGNTNIYGAFGKTIINSDVSFNQLKLNNRLIGSGEVTSVYDPENDLVKINGFSAFARDLDGNLMKNIEFDGYYLPKKKEDNLDITFKAEPFDVSLLQPFLKDILTFKIGYLNGAGRITGTPDKPLINGKFKFFKCVMLVDFTNVQYSVNGSIDIMPTQINFDNLEMRDTRGNLGIVSGNIFHNNFKDMRIDFDINTTKLMVLNTTAANNPAYYGTAYASGNAGIYGFVDDIRMEINMKTNGGTYFYIPLDGPSEIGSNDFIRFVSKDTIKQVVNKTPSNFSLDFNLEATPDAEVQLIFDAKSGDVIKARGAGNLNMKINSKGKFDIFGDYELTTGDYLFTLENFVTKKFEIQKGSIIKFNGDVYNANIDIAAIYRQRASVRPIYPADSSGKRYTVECKLYMKNKLTQPDISFGIDLPTIDESTRSAIKSILLDENELNRQVFSLLLLRSFITPIAATGGGGITAGGAVANTGSEMLSNKLSNWLNGVTKEVDVGVNYRPGTGLSNDELDLTLNKQLFNNRLVIDGNFGVANNTNSAKSTTSTNNSSNLIGDVTLEYKLTESGRYRVKGFNRSNDNTQVINSGGPFTQGVGIFYREEFENLSELYRRYLARLKGKPKVK